MTSQLNAPALQEDSAYHAIFEASSDGLVINDPETGVVLEANPAFCAMHGYDRMVGLHPTTFIHPNSHHLFDEYVRAIREGREFRARAQDVRRDGTVFEIEVLGRGFQYHGRFALLGVVRDVTEQVRAYQILEERVAERTREIERRREVAEGLRDLLATLNSTHSLDEILAQVLAQAARLLGNQGGAIYLPTEGPGEQVLGISASSGLERGNFVERVPIGLPVTGMAFTERRPVAVYDTIAALSPADDASPRPEAEDRSSHLRVSRFWDSVAQVGGGYARRFQEVATHYRAVMAVPLAARDRTYGSLTLYYLEPREFSHDEVWLATAFANQAALAIENARLHTAAALRLHEQEALYRADEALHRSLDLTDVLHTLAEVAIGILEADNAAVCVWDAQRTRLTVGAAAGFPAGVMAGVEFAPGEGAVGRVAMTGETIAVEDIFSDPRASKRFAETVGLRAGLCVPVTVSDEIFGVFTVGSSRVRAFTANEQRLLLSLAQRAGLAISNARVHGDSEQRRRELEALYRADEALHRSLRLQDVLEALVDAASDLLHADGVGLWSRDPEQPGNIVPLASRGLSSDFLQESIEINRHPRMRELWALHETVVSEDAIHDERFPLRLRAALEREGYRAVISTRVSVGEEVFGTFSVGMRDVHVFGDSEMRLLSTLSSRAAQAIQNARLHEESEQQRHELQALYQADEALHRSLRLSDVLDALVDAAAGLLRADSAGLWGPDPRDHGRIVPLASRGLSAKYLEESIRLNDEPAVVDYWSARELFAVEDVSRDPHLAPAQRMALEREGFRSFLSMQIRDDDRGFGSFTVGHKSPHRYSGPEQRLLVALAQRAALAIRNARLYEQAQQAATLEERQRLARELHDAVTQTLFSTALIAEVIPALWELDPEDGRRQLADLRRLTRGALAEMRTLLVELRPGALTELTLAELLRQLAEAAAGRTRVAISATVEGEPRRFPGGVQVALYRIAQEALNNVIKHARASQAGLTLTDEADGSVRFCLSDDGCGFDPDTVQPGHFGMGTMRERAEGIGATFHVASRPGHGTSIEVHLRQTEDSTRT